LLFDTVLDSMTAEARAAMRGAEECGLGRLLLHLLNILADDVDADELGQTIQFTEPLHSPLMTMLIDIPWAEVTGSGWPFAAVLHQISLRRRPIVPPEFDGLEGLHQQFHTFLTDSLAELTEETIEQVSLGAQQYIEALRDTQPMPLGTAAAALASGLATRDESALVSAQEIMQKLIQSPQDLDDTFVSHWPVYQLWSLYS
jgi:hypothetical protein